MLAKRTDLCASLLTLVDLEEETVARKVIELILNTSKLLRPTRYDVYEPERLKVAEATVEDLADVWTNKRNKAHLDSLGYGMGQLLMCNGRNYNEGASYMIKWEKNERKRPASINIFYFPTERTRKLALEEIIQLWFEIAKIAKPMYGEIRYNLLDTQWQGLDFAKRLPEIPWMLLLGKPYIDLFGRDKVLSAPCYAVHDIDDDLIALQMTEDIFAGDVPAEVRQAVKDHLGADAFVEAGKNIRYYKTPGLVPELDYSNVTFRKPD